MDIFQGPSRLRHTSLENMTCPAQMFFFVSAQLKRLKLNGICWSASSKRRRLAWLAARTGSPDWHGAFPFLRLRTASGGCLQGLSFLRLYPPCGFPFGFPLTRHQKKGYPHKEGPTRVVSVLGPVQTLWQEEYLMQGPV